MTSTRKNQPSSRRPVLARLHQMALHDPAPVPAPPPCPADWLLSTAVRSPQIAILGVPGRGKAAAMRRLIDRANLAVRAIDRCDVVGQRPAAKPGER